MMNHKFRTLGTVAALAAAVAAAGCDDFLEVPDPTVIDAATIDPVEDLPTFASSGLQNLFDAFDGVVVNSGWFSGEIWVGDTFPTRNDIGRRVVELTNGTLLGDLYAPLELAIASNETVLELAAQTEAPNPGIVAGANFASAFAIMLTAENFCEVVISSSLDDLGPNIPSDQAMGEAITRFQAAINAATAANDSIILNAARVGLARAHLFLGQYAEAIAAAEQVPADFEFFAPKIDDPSFRGRLGNEVYLFTSARASIVVPPYYRALDDDRVTFDLLVSEEGDTLQSQGNNFDFYYQTKYEGWGTPIRMASGLQAQYLAAEAHLKMGNPAPALALIAARQDPGSATGDDIDFVASTGTLVQLLDQKARDHWLETTHMGDWRRNPDLTPYVPPAGSSYYAEETVGGEFGSLVCMPTPEQEQLNNPEYN